MITRTPSSALRELENEWSERRATFVAPLLIGFEVTNALHRWSPKGLTEEQIERALTVFRELPIDFVDYPWLHRDAAALARRFHQPAVYDAHYLAVSLHIGAEFFTSDRRFSNAVSPHLSWVRFVPYDG
jgi:predicted nucleic acid-binding protein